MWLFTTYGFYSAVCARQDGDGRSIDPDRMMIRGRRREHLDRLVNRFPKQLADAEIIDYMGTDYKYRIFLPKAAWAEILRELAMETNYDNFKNKVAVQLKGEPDIGDYEDALHTIWEVMYHMQE